MMNCVKAGEFVDAWENGTQQAGEFPDFRIHVEGCRECSARFGSLVSLIARDSLGAGEWSSGSLPEGFSAGVMRSLESSARKGKRIFSRFALASAAAAALFVAGLGIGSRVASGQGDMVTVRFVLEAREAKSVHLAGDFNDWNAEGYELRRGASDSRWELRVPLKKGRVYVYNFIVDGEDWIEDPTAPVRIDDGFGGSGSLLRL
jgi:hypothetical protein